ncbi:MAG: CHAD domain-containing protein [Chloroherpetonaceae bacterium]|nr:CHAD domain-containing protein [bacterium]
MMQLVFEKYQNSSEDFRAFMFEIINEKYSIYKEKLTDCTRKMSDDNVHNLRVSSRRFLSVLNLYKQFYPTLYFSMISKMVKKNFKNMGRLRDVQVMIENCQLLKIQFPIIYDFINYLLTNEKKIITNFSQGITDININELDGMMYFLIHILKYDFPEIKHNFSAFEIFLDDKLKSLRTLYNQITPTNSKTIHKFRIAVKKYRYVIEILQDFVPDYKQLYKRLVRIQDRAGEIQDLAVLINEFEIFANKKGYATDELNLQKANIIDFLKNKQQQQIADFLNDSAEINSIFE